MFVSAEFKNGGSEEEDAVLGHALRTTGSVVLLFEDEPFPQRCATAAVFLGPRHHGPTSIEQFLFPLDMKGEAFGGIS